MKKTVKYFSLLIILLSQYNVGTIGLYANKIYKNEEEALQEEIKKIKESDSTETKTYPIKIKYQDEKTGLILEKTIYFTLVGDNTVFNGDEVINANNATINRLAVLDSKETDWINLTQAKAWKKIDNSPVIISEIDVSNIKPIAGEYQISFKTVNNTMTTAKITVVEDKRNNHEIYSENMFLSFWQKFGLFSITFLWFVLLFLPFILLLSQYRKVRKIIKDAYELLQEKIKK